MSGHRGWAALDARDNALNAIRLGLAMLVVVGHSYVLGYGAWPVAGIHERAVEGFFAISGYLIASSRDRLPLGQFLWRRARRVYPGLWASLAVTAFVIAPAGAALAGQPFSWADAGWFVWSNATSLIQRWDISGGPIGVPYPGAWNGSLWSLSYELGCYVVFGLVLGLPRQQSAIASGTLLVLATAIQAVHPAVADLFVVHQSLRLGGFFTAGALLYHLRDRIPYSPRLGYGSGAVVAVTMVVGPAIFAVAAPLAFAYLLLWSAAGLRIRAGVRNDISYGMYVYAFPVQQMLVLAGAAAAPPVVLVGLSIVLTMPLAWGSWVLIERPAMRLRRLEPSSRSGPTRPNQAPRAVSLSPTPRPTGRFEGT